MKFQDVVIKNDILYIKINGKWYKKDVTWELYENELSKKQKIGFNTED